MISQLVVLAILILLNAYFAASEIAFISLNDAKIEKQAKEGNKKAKQIFSNNSNRNYTCRIFIKCICIRHICRHVSTSIIQFSTIY